VAVWREVVSATSCSEEAAMFDSQTVSAGMTALMEQAPATVNEYLREATAAVDEQFGEGYAKAHPELVGAFIQAAAGDFHTSLMKMGCQEIAAALGRIADAMAD
jgi:hypothetical protein